MSPTRKREPRPTSLNDDQHAGQVYDLLGQDEVWLTHNEERLTIEAMAAPHALAALRKIVEYARLDMLGEYSLEEAVATPLAVALRLQALGETVVQADLDHLAKRARAKTVVVSGVKPSIVLAAVEELDVELAQASDPADYVHPVDYAVRLTELINERLKQ